MKTYEHMLATEGIALDALGLTEVALRRAHALDAIEALRDSSATILGGDVYVERAGAIEPAYANWYVEPEPGEDAGEFAKRSCVKAESYVETYPRRTAVRAGGGKLARTLRG